jgi:hypothetical protein
MQQAEDEYFDRLWLEAQQLVPTPQYDPVNKPKHYMLFPVEGIEVRDVIEQLVTKMWLSPLSTKGGVMHYADYVQLMQYLMRFMDKNGVEDLKKAEYYLKKMIEAYDSHA